MGICAVAPIRDGKSCGKNDPSIHPTSTYNFCKDKQKNEAGVEVSLAHLETRPIKMPGKSEATSLLQVDVRSSIAVAKASIESSQSKKGCKLVCRAKPLDIRLRLHKAKQRLKKSKYEESDKKESEAEAQKSDEIRGKKKERVAKAKVTGET